MIEKILNKYCIATLTTTTLYIKSLGSGKYILTDDVAQATKTMSRKVANQVLHYYKYDTGDTQDFVVVPVKITYELINESEMEND